MSSPKLMHDLDNQAYMIARQLNSGVLVAETVPACSSEPAVAGQGSALLHRMTGGRFGSPPVVKPSLVPTAQKRLFLPYGTEGVIVVLPVEILRDNVLRFCPLEKAVGTPDFHGVEEATEYDEERVEVFTRNRIAGFLPHEKRKAVIRCLGDRRRLSAIVEELVPLNN